MKSVLYDASVAFCGGSFVLSVKKEYKNQITGTVVDISGTGSTCFIEPAAVRKLQDELEGLQIDEENEVLKILRTNEKGELGIQIKGKKQIINHKRIKLLNPASELYPDNYDFSIVFDTVENRKARHKMEKGHRPDLSIKYEE